MSEPLRLDERIGTMVWAFDAPEHKAEVRQMAKEAKALFDERDSLKEQLAKSQAGAMREFESHQETIGKLDAMRVERNTQSAHLAEMGRELRAVEEQNAALRAALERCVVVMPESRCDEPDCIEHRWLRNVSDARAAARKALGQS